MPLPTVKTTSKSTGAFFEDLCTESDARDTVIVACCSRAYFLEQFLAYANNNSGRTPLPDEAQNGSNDENPIMNEVAPSELKAAAPSTSALLQPTLKILAMSSRTQLVFCPSIPSFKGYMSVVAARQGSQSNTPWTMIVLDMLALYHGTSDFTVQGLSRSFSLLASVNHSMDGDMQLVECIDDQNPSGNERGPRMWNTEVRLLSGSVKIGEAGQGWATRKICIRKFAERWFHFD